MTNPQPHSFFPHASGELEGVAGEALLVTGAAGFIGSNLVRQLFARYPGIHIVGVDNLNDYYDPALKHERLAQIEALDAHWTFVRADISDKAAVDALFAEHHFSVVVNLAAQAGVRYSIDHPDAYISSNIVGFYNILEACRHYPVQHLVYASSSSVYGANSKVPYSTDDTTDTPVSLYAATKKSNELLAHAYSKLYGIPTTGLRFFTVYGPAGRPDMAYYKFADLLRQGKTIQLYNYGHCRRDFTYIDDIVEGTMRTLDHVPDPAECPNGVPFRVFNIGCSNPVKLMDFISEIEQAVGRPAEKIFLPMQAGDVYQTNADTTHLEEQVGYKPHVTLHEGIGHFIEWYKSDKNPLKD